MYILRKNSHGFSEANHYLNVKADHFIQLICKSLSYRNQSTDLLYKSMDWFLSDNGLRPERVKWLLLNRWISTLTDKGRAGIYSLKVNNGNTKITSQICSKLAKKTLKPCCWRCFRVFIVDFEQISNIVLVFPLLNLNK